MRPSTRGTRLREALEAFLETIEATGGVTLWHEQWHVPVADPDWLDLGEAYVAACRLLGRPPVIGKEEVHDDLSLAGGGGG